MLTPVPLPGMITYFLTSIAPLKPRLRLACLRLADYRGRALCSRKAGRFDRWTAGTLAGGESPAAAGDCRRLSQGWQKGAHASISTPRRNTR